MEAMQSLLDVMDKGAAIVRNGAVVACNTAMLELSYVAGAPIAVDAPLPGALCELLDDVGEGTTTLGARQLDYTTRTLPTGEVLLLLWQEEKQLGRETLDGFFYRLREEMSVSSVSLDGLGAMSELERLQRVSQMKKSFYGMVRLLEQVEILRGEYTHRALDVVDITVFCQRMQMEIWALMEEIGVSITVEPQDYHLCVKVEGDLLERFLLSNISTAIEQGATQIWLKPSLSARRAKLVIEDNRPARSAEQSHLDQLRMELLGAQTRVDVAAIREMVRLMGGRMLVVQNKDGGTRCTFSLPVCKAGVSVFAPNMDDNQRYNRLLVHFASLLPAKVFRGREIE